MSTNNYISLLRDNSNYIKSNFNVNAMSLFGSVARNEHHKGSDVDICVDMPPKILLISGLKIYLESLLGCEVDVLRKHNSMNKDLKEAIEHDEKIIF